MNTLSIAKLYEFITRALALAGMIALIGGAQAQESLPGKAKSVQPIRPAGIAANLFPVEVADIGLRKLGYTVKPVLEADYAPLHLAIAQGDADFMATEWIPTHDTFFQRAGGNKTMERIGVIVPNAIQGYYIDKKTADKYHITNLGQFRDPAIAKLFDRDGNGKANLTGCNAGWGCEQVIEHQLTEFKLRDTVTDDQGSYFALMADTITRFNHGDPIFYYTWSPQWVDAVLKPGKDVIPLNVPYSADPSGVDTKLPDGSNPGLPEQQNRLPRQQDVHRRQSGRQTPVRADPDPDRRLERRHPAPAQRRGQRRGHPRPGARMGQPASAAI